MAMDFCRSQCLTSPSQKYPSHRLGLVLDGETVVWGFWAL
jgi:hypothetical protein